MQKAAQKKNGATPPTDEPSDGEVGEAQPDPLPAVVDLEAHIEPPLREQATVISGTQPSSSPVPASDEVSPTIPAAPLPAALPLQASDVPAPPGKQLLSEELHDHNVSAMPTNSELQESMAPVDQPSNISSLNSDPTMPQSQHHETTHPSVTNDTDGQESTNENQPMPLPVFNKTSKPPSPTPNVSNVEIKPQMPETAVDAPKTSSKPSNSKNDKNQSIPTSAPSIAKPKPSRSTPSGKPKKNRINWASADCGAKVLAANEEAMDASSVLTSSKDRYMLNPCSVKRQWIVIELCEEVGIDYIQIANFEFFSSTIKDIQVLASNQYPTKSWALLGNFTLSNERELQSLFFGSESQIYPEWFKYIKLRILSHWGNEFYCPITEIQVLGRPYVDKLQQELDQNAKDIKDLEASFLNTGELLDDGSSLLPTSVHHALSHDNPQSPSSPSSDSTIAEKATKHAIDSFTAPVGNMVSSIKKLVDKLTSGHDDYLAEEDRPAAKETSASAAETNPDTPSSPPPQSKPTQPSSHTSDTSKEPDVISHTPVTEPKSQEKSIYKETTPMPVQGGIDMDNIPAYDFVHTGLPPPKPKIGGDDDGDDGDELEEALKMDALNEALSRKVPTSIQPIMQLMSTLITRVTELQRNYSYIDGYLQSFPKDVDKSFVEVSARLASLHRNLAQTVGNMTLAQHKMAVDWAEASDQMQQSLESLLVGTMRVYLLYSALLSLLVCSIGVSLVVIIFKCLPESASNHSSKSYSLASSDPLALSPSSSQILRAVKDDPLAHIHTPFSAPSTPPPLAPTPPVPTMPPLPATHDWSFLPNHMRRRSLPLLNKDNTNDM